MYQDRHTGTVMKRAKNVSQIELIRNGPEVRNILENDHDICNAVMACL